MPDPLRKLPFDVDGKNPNAIKQAFKAIGSLVEPTAEVKISAEAEGEYGANARRFTITVSDLLPIGQRWEGRWLVLVYITPNLNGDPSATGNTAAFSAGTIIQTILANATYLVLTDTTGKLQVDLTVSGAANRHVYAEVLGKPIGSGATAWV